MAVIDRREQPEDGRNPVAPNGNGVTKHYLQDYKPMEVHLTNGMGVRKEHSRALQAFEVYLSLPVPRRLEDMLGKEPKRKGSSKPKPYTMSTLRHWSWMFNWKERALEHDALVLTERERRIRQWRADEADKRERERLTSSSAERQIALEYLIDAATGKPKKLAILDPRRAEIAAKYLKDAAESERLDLGVPTSRTEITGNEEAPIKAEVKIVDGAGLEQLRSLVAGIITQRGGRSALAGDDITDVEPPVRGELEAT